jgi:hypothetical protein
MADVLVSGATSMVGSWFAANTPRSIAVGGRRDPQLDGGRAERFDFVDITVPETLSHCVVRSPEPALVIFHLASPTLTTPFEFGTTVLESFAETGTGIVRGCSIFDSVAPGRAPRPVRGGLSSKRLEKLGVVPTPWQDGVRKLAEEERGRL